MADVNEFIAKAMLAPDVEALFRSIVSDPSAAVAFLTLTPEEQAGVIEGLVGVAREARKEIVKEWLRDEPKIKFISAQQVIDDMAEVVKRMIADDETINPAEAYYGLILDTLHTKGPEVRQAIINALIGVFGTDSPLFDDIAITQGQIDFLLLTLMELAGEYDVTVKYSVEGDPRLEHPRFDPPFNDPRKGQVDREHGGFAFANQPYFVGEAGRELFVPFNSGTIIPNKDLNSKEVTYNLNVYGSEDTGFDARTILLTAQTIGAF